MLKIDKENLYIIFGKKCNLRCRLCYVDFNKVDNNNIKKEDLLSFIERYIQINPDLKKVGWCGFGEIFIDKSFIETLNLICERFPYLHHYIQTNGTIISQLSEIKRWDLISEISVSVDGLEKSHDWNRGNGSFNKTVDFIKTLINKYKYDSICLKILVTYESMKDLFLLPQFFLDISLKIRFEINVPYDYYILKNLHLNYEKDLSVIPENHKLVNLEKLNEYVKKNDLTKYYGELNDNSKCDEVYFTLDGDFVYTCCELIFKIGNIHEDIFELFEKLKESSRSHCNNCIL